MATTADLYLIAFGAFLGLILTIFMLPVTNWYDKRKLMGKVKNSLLNEVEMNIKAFEINNRHHTYPIPKEVLFLTISSGILSDFEKDLRKTILSAYGKISIYNGKLSLSQTRMSNADELEDDIQDDLQEIKDLLNTKTT